MRHNGNLSIKVRGLQYALDDVNQAYADMRSGVNIRGVVDFIPAG
jgi:Zn-dependent alcohol dehydrogenase